MIQMNSLLLFLKRRSVKQNLTFQGHGKAEDEDFEKANAVTATTLTSKVTHPHAILLVLPRNAPNLRRFPSGDICTFISSEQVHNTAQF